jgi:hypothetical protein
MTMLSASTQEGERKKWPMLRKLQIAVPAVCGVLCLLLVVLWVRSYSYSDELRWSFAENRIIWFDSKLGVTSFSSIPLRGPAWPATIISEPIEQPVPTAGFAFHRTRGAWSLSVPHWFLVPVLSTLASVPGLKRRFSLRTLLIAMTLIALGLGILTIWN